MMEKYGVASVTEDQKAALAATRERLTRLRAVLEKTASETSEETVLETRAAELEAALAAQ